MPTTLGSAQEFARTLAEVDILLHESDVYATGMPAADEDKVAVMNKSAVLLLTGKFEAFLESAAEDFLFAINSLDAHSRILPERLLIEHSVRAIESVERKLNNGDLSGIRTVFESLGRQWMQIDTCSDLEIPVTFNYGRHGETQIVQLFKRLGIDDVFDDVKVTDDSENAYEGAGAAIVDVKGIVNSLTGLRNNILHQDATPNLTVASLRKQSAILQRFATALIDALQKVIDRIEFTLQSSQI